MKRIIAASALCLATLPAAAGPLAATGESENYVGLILGSRHFGSEVEPEERLNDNTPGITFGRRFELEADGWERFIEGGVFYNSYREVSPILLAGYSASVAELGSADIRVGGFVGVGYYAALGKSLNETYGLPYVAGFIPLVGAAASVRYGRHELRLTTVPAENIDAIANLSYTFAF